MPYKVANPRGVPQGVRILRTENKEWFEGDSIKPSDLGDAWQHYLDTGFVVSTGRRREVTDG
jgi:hypothetical protein